MEVVWVGVGKRVASASPYHSLRQPCEASVFCRRELSESLSPGLPSAQSSLRKLARRAGFGEVFSAENIAAAEAAVRSRVEAMAEKLATRVHQEIGSLPFTSCALYSALLW